MLLVSSPMPMPSSPWLLRLAGVAWMVIVAPLRAIVIVIGCSGCFAIVSFSCEANVMGWPSIATTTSPVISPAFSAGSPALTERTCGWTFGSTPMSPISNRVCPAGVSGVTLRESSRPLRSSPSDVSRLGRDPTAM